MGLERQVIGQAEGHIPWIFQPNCIFTEKVPSWWSCEMRVENYKSIVLWCVNMNSCCNPQFLMTYSALFIFTSLSIPSYLSFNYFLDEFPSRTQCRGFAHNKMLGRFLSLFKNKYIKSYTWSALNFKCVHYNILPPFNISLREFNNQPNHENLEIVADIKAVELPYP